MEKELKAIEEGVQSFHAKADALAADVKAAKEIAEAAKTAAVTLDETVKMNQAVIDNVQSWMQESKANDKRTVSFKDAIGQELEKRKSDLVTYRKNRQAITMDLKAVGNMASGNFTTSGTQGWVDPAASGPVGRAPYEMAHVRNLPGISTTSVAGTTDIFVIRDAGGEGGPTKVDVGAAKPQTDRDYVKLIVPITKIAHYFKVPEEYLEDIAWLQSEISTIGIEELMAKEDDLFLNQTGAAGAFAGLTKTTNSTAYSSPASLALLVPTPNNYDVLVAAWTQLRNLKNTANAVIVNPSDYAAMILSKSTSGEYVFGAPNMAIPQVYGVPVVPHTALASDKFLLGDFSKVRIAQRAGVSVRFYDQNEDDAIKNMVTVVIEERVAIVADRSDRLIFGDFSDARTALTKP